jgi:hypothetical protein
LRPAANFENMVGRRRPKPEPKALELKGAHE